VLILKGLLVDDFGQDRAKHGVCLQVLILRDLSGRKAGQIKNSYGTHGTRSPALQRHVYPLSSVREWHSAVKGILGVFGGKLTGAGQVMDQNGKT
jgi:hypothetical protein